MAALQLIGLPAAQIAEILGLSTRAVEIRAAKEGWVHKSEKAARGRRRVYLIHPLPTDVRAKVLEHLTTSAPQVPAPAPTVPAPTAGPRLSIQASQLDGWQRRCMEARAAILAHVRALAAAGGVNEAMRRVAAAAAAGTLPAGLQMLVADANARGGKAGSRTLSVPTLKRWWGLWKAAGWDAVALVPVDTAPEPTVPSWGPHFLRAYQIPSQPSVTQALALTVLPAGVERPSVHQVRRWLDKLSPLERERGRKGRGALRALKPFVRRTTDHLDPLDVVIADGHTHKADVAHPVHAQPFAPELTVVRDVATRRCIGWSAGWAESTWTVLDAFAHAARVTGQWVMAYTDNGSGFRSEINAGDVAGLMGRVGATHEFGRPGNPQGRGQIERGWQRLFIAPAKQLPAFRGKTMDPEARKKVVKLIARDIKDHGQSPLLQSWPEFLAWAQAQIDAYNAAPHQGLPKIRDAVTGKLRHQSPDEAWQEALERGWEPMRLPQHQLDGLFRPHLVRQVARGEVSLFGARYFSQDLADFHGDKVRVGWDIHDPSHVWVSTLEGVQIAVATLDGNARPYFDRIKVERAKGRRDRLLSKLALVDTELQPDAIEGTATVLDAETEALADAALQALDAPATPPAPTTTDGRPTFDDDESWGRWVQANPAQATEWDRQRFANLCRNQNFRLLLDLPDDYQPAPAKTVRL